MIAPVVSTEGVWRLDLREAASARRPALPEVGSLGPVARGTWHRRMVNEFSSSHVFEGLAAQVRAAGMAGAWADECASFAAEEREHGVLCGAVVEALGGAALADVAPQAVFPWHRAVAPREGVARNALSVGCLSETIAVALIGAERLEMPEGPLRALLTGIYADEVGHARFGWRLVRELMPGFDAAARARLGAYLSVAFAHLERHELAHLPEGPPHPPAAAAFGVCDGGDARTLFYETVEGVIVRGLEALGLPARDAWQARSLSASAALRFATGARPAHSRRLRRTCPRRSKACGASTRPRKR